MVGRIAARPQWRILLLGLVLAAAVLGSGCPRKEEPLRLRIRGAPSMDAIASDLASGFREAHPETQVVLDCVCPPCVVYEGAPPAERYDVWMAWGDWELDRLSESAELSFADKSYPAHTTLVLAVGDQADPPITGLSDLGSPGVRGVGVGDPEMVAAGHYAKEALDAAGEWQAIEDRFVFSRSGCELLKWLGLDREIDAAIVFEACLTHDGDAVDAVRPLPEDLVPPIPLVFARTADAPNAEGAKRFLEYVEGPRARSILESHKLHGNDGP